MNSKFLQAKLASERRRKIRSDRGLKIFLVVFVLGYSLFFFSRYFFPKIYKNVAIARYGDVLELGDYTLTLDSWDYAEDDRCFEILFGLQNLSLDREPDISFTCRSGEDICRDTIYRLTDDLLVLRVRDVPRRWAQVSLTVRADDERQKIWMDDRQVHVVDALTDKSDHAYAVYAAQNRIRGYETTLSELAQEKAGIKADIEYTYAKLEQLTAKQASQTTWEQEETADDIRTVASKQTQLQNDLEDLLLQENLLKEKIEGQKLKLQQLGGDTP